jgi:glutamyl-tRNA reductase
MIVSTCNRVELLAAVDGPQTDITGFLHHQFGLDRDLLAPHIYQQRDQEAVRHLFRVAASLDSMVVGEPQILGQVKEAFAVARASGTIAGQLEHLLQSAFAAAKKVRSETEIGSNSVSIASVAVEMARKIFGSLQGRTVFLVGAGKMSELAARHLVQQGAGTILVTNRTQARAEHLAEAFKGRVIPYEAMYDAAVDADIVISSTGAPHPIFRKEHGQRCMQRRKNRPMFFTSPFRATWTQRWASSRASSFTTSTTCRPWPRRTLPSAAGRQAMPKPSLRARSNGSIRGNGLSAPHR